MNYNYSSRRKKWVLKTCNLVHEHFASPYKPKVKEAACEEQVSLLTSNEIKKEESESKYDLPTSLAEATL